MASTTLFLICVITLRLIKSQQSDCIFTDTSGSGAVLDLRSLEKAVINGTRTDKTEYPENWIYSPCRNGQTCPPGGSNMVRQQVYYNSDVPPSCIPVTYWDNGEVQPVYSKRDRTFTFVYNNSFVPCYNIDNGQTIDRQLTLQWKCNKDAVEPRIVELTGNDETCGYYMLVESNIPCNITLPPEFPCKWSLHGRELDLSTLKGNIISKLADNDNTLNYQYTPCSNGLTCGNIDNMIEIQNLTSSGDCFRYLGKWNNGIVLPNYNSNLQSWQFTYTNGEDCDGFEDITQIYWNCDLDAGEYTVIEASRVTTCIYVMRINSKYACD